jgi:hypothetical protein
MRQAIFIKRLALAASTPLFSTVLLAQYVGPIGFGVGVKTAQPDNLLGGMVGMTPSIGAISDVKCYFANARMAVRIRGSFDNWGNQHLRGTIDDRCEVKRLASTIGFMLNARRNSELDFVALYVCLDIGTARWSIDSTYPPLAKQHVSKPAGALVVGGENLGRRIFLELGLDLSFLPKDIKPPAISYSFGRAGAAMIAFGIRL